jgi:hypothetical protein
MYFILGDISVHLHLADAGKNLNEVNFSFSTFWRLVFVGFFCKNEASFSNFFLYFAILYIFK